LNDGVLVLAGPTAGGKTELALALARSFGAEIVGADSRQIYRGMTVGTAAPDAAQRALVRHHLVEILDPAERYSAARYARDAMGAIADIRARGKRAIVAGGTGFYVRALTGGVDLAPQYDPAIRRRLAREALAHPPEFLHAWLALRDPQRAAQLATGDAYRVLRALEISLVPGGGEREGPIASLPGSGIAFLKVFIDLPDDELDARIERRTDAMLASGLIEEAERIGGDAVAADAVGYPQALAYLRGWSTRDELRAQLVRATRRYARRQRSWFRREPGTRWLAAAEVERAVREMLGWS
jgi:tRNA dimethylallyltransferase